MCSYRNRGDEIYQFLKTLYPKNGGSKFLRIFDTFFKAYMKPHLEVSSNESIIIHMSRVKRKIKYFCRVLNIKQNFDPGTVQMKNTETLI